MAQLMTAVSRRTAKPAAAARWATLLGLLSHHEERSIPTLHHARIGWKAEMCLSNLRMRNTSQYY
jgi:predicted secreted Zn-dependent protease